MEKLQIARRALKEKKTNVQPVKARQAEIDALQAQIVELKANLLKAFATPAASITPPATVGASVVEKEALSVKIESPSSSPALAIAVRKEFKDAGCQTINLPKPQQVAKEEEIGAVECRREPLPSPVPMLSPLFTTPLLILNEEDDEQGLAISYRALLA